MSDLVKRLRDKSKEHSDTFYFYDELLDEAADALERAEAYWDQETRRADAAEAKLAIAIECLERLAKENCFAIEALGKIRKATRAESNR